MAKTPPPAPGSVRRAFVSASVVVALTATLAAAGSCNDLPQGNSESSLTNGAGTGNGSADPGGTASAHGRSSNSPGVGPGVTVTPGLGVRPGGRNTPAVGSPASPPPGTRGVDNPGGGGSGAATPVMPSTASDGGMGNTAEPEP